MQSPQSTKGSTLAISLVILTAITLISISSLQRSGLQSRMVGSIQHKEEGFHAANNEHESIFEYYWQGTNKSNPSAEAAAAFEELFKAANSNYKVVNNKKVYDSISPKHISAYPSNSHSSVTIASNTRFKNLTRSEGNSHNMFKDHNFEVNISAFEPNSLSGAQGKVISNQVLGIKFLAPAS